MKKIVLVMFMLTTFVGVSIAQESGSTEQTTPPRTSGGTNITVPPMREQPSAPSTEVTPYGGMVEAAGGESPTTKTHLLLKESGSGFPRIRYIGTASTPVNNKFWDLRGDIFYPTDANNSFALLYGNSSAWIARPTATAGRIHIGIGEEAPATKLHIGGGDWNVATSSGDFRIGPSAYHFKIGVAIDGAGAGDVRLFTNGGTDRMIFGTDSTDRMSITNTGNVGINTITPGSSRLMVVHNTSGIDTSPHLNFRQTVDGNYARIRFENQDGAKYFLHKVDLFGSTAADYNYYLGYAGSNDITLRGNGNVGIGTDTPDNKLDVLGTIRANEVIVETGWADYVFEDTYKLADLKDVEEFIAQHKHLPNIPSAKEVQEKGAHVSELLTKMMAKIEELTLYTIQQQKELDALKLQLARSNNN